MLKLDDEAGALLALAAQPGWLLAGVLGVAVLVWAMIWLLQPLARPLGLLDHPHGDRKHHANPTPVTGGPGIALALLLLFALVPLPMTQAKIAYLAGAGLLIGVGVLDDLVDLRWWWRILAQVVAALLMVYLGGVRIEQLGPAFGLSDLALGWLSVPFTVFATVGLVNATNMIDGADGIAGALIAAALLMLAAAAWYAGNLGLALVTLAWPRPWGSWRTTSRCHGGAVRGCSWATAAAPSSAIRSHGSPSACPRTPAIRSTRCWRCGCSRCRWWTAWC